ncbi:MAG: hypothetical protein AAFY56_16120 [Pseudomonadota bacterium]
MRHLRAWDKIMYGNGASLAVFSLAATLLSVGGAVAQEDHEAAARAIVAAHTDANQDGLIDEAELTNNLAAAFVALDINADGRLTPDELDEHDTGQFERVDANGDGTLSFVEVMQAKIDDLKSVDANGDGALSPDELVALENLR